MAEASIYESSEVDYDVVVAKYGSYEHIQTTCQEALTSVAPTSGQNLTFQALGSNTMNLAKSYLETVLTVDAQGAGTFLWMNAGCIPFFRSVQFQPLGGGQNLYMDQFHHYSKMATQYLLSATQLKTMDNTNMIFPSRVLQSSNKLPANGFNAAIPYDDVQYCINLDNGTANSAAQWIIKLPFSLFVGTILAEARDHYFGQAINIIFTIEDPSKWIWTSTSATDPTAGAAALAVTTNLKFTNLYCQFAIEQDEKIRDYAYKRYLSGYTCYIDNVQKLYQQSLTGASQNIVCPPINSGYGRFLKRILISPFASTENLNTALDNCNQAASPITTVATNRVITFQTLLDSKPRQQKYIYASPNVQGVKSSTYTITTAGTNDDWSRFKDFFSGSCFFSSGVLGLNYVVVDDFTIPESRAKKNLSDGHKIEGLDLSLGDHTWQFLSTNANSTFNWYVFIQTLKTMEVGPGKLYIH